MEAEESTSSRDSNPTSVDLKTMKQMLLSGDKEQILQSIHKIQGFTNNEKSVSMLIKADISEFLCDAVAPFDAVTFEAICYCLEVMTKHVEFYSHSHSCFTIESIIRSIHFLLKDSFSVGSLYQCLSLLVLIIQRFKSFDIAPRRKTIRNLLQIVPELLKNNIITIAIKQEIGNLLLGLVDLDTPRWNNEFLEKMLTYCIYWFNSIQDVFESLHPSRDKFISLSCFLSDSFLRCLSNSNEIMSSENEALRNTLISTVCNFLTTSAIFYFDNLALGAIESQTFVLESFFETLLYIYNRNMTPKKNILSHCLSEKGFMQFTTRVLSFADFSHGENLRRLCMLVLSHVIVSLTEDVFYHPEIWRNSCIDFQNEIKEGISLLPLDASQWLDILASPLSPSSCKMALLLYLYFYSITAKSEVILENIYPAVVNFINFSSELPKSILMIKVVWFVFVMSQLSSSQSSSTDGEVDAVDKMISLLDSIEDFSLVYTHHPALLYWVFSSKVNSSIQFNTVRLWLRNKTPDCRELEELIGKSSEMRFAILGVLQNECGQILDAAFSTIKSVLNATSNEDLVSNIWYLLPQVLAKYTTGSASAMNVDYIIELSSLKTPNSLDTTKVIRIISLLPEILIKSDLISIVPSLSLICQLLELGFQAGDSRVMSVFLRFDGFFQKILEGMNANISEVSSSCLRILTLLWRNSKELENVEDDKKVKLKKETIVDPFGSPSAEVILAALDLLQQVLVTSFQSPIFVIEELDLDFVEILFLETQNLCVKYMSDILSKSWHCLKLFLQIETINSLHVKDELASHPLLHEVINFHLPLLKDSPEMKDFLVTWINAQNSTFGSECFWRKMFGGWFLETLQRVADTLTGNYQQGDEMLYQKLIKSGVSVL